MNRLIKLSIVAAVLLVAAIFSTSSNKAEAGYGYGYGYRHYGYRYTPTYYYPTYHSFPVYNYGYCY